MALKEKFVRFLIGSGALVFGDFTLKSGRKSPYMINTGKIDSGIELARLGCYYARTIYEKIELGVIPRDITILFGSAYKGIPLATTTAIAASAAYGLKAGYAFNRKEAKDHGEGGVFVGRKPGHGDKVLVIDDVMTAGTALRDTVDMIGMHAPEAKVVGSVIAVDRCERGRDERLTAVAETQYEMGFPIFSIISIDEIVELLKSGRLIDGFCGGDAEDEALDEKGASFRVDICGNGDGYDDGYADKIRAALPTKEQIAAIESYLKEFRPR